MRWTQCVVKASRFQLQRFWGAVSSGKSPISVQVQSGTNISISHDDRSELADYQGRDDSGRKHSSMWEETRIKKHIVEWSTRPGGDSHLMGLPWAVGMLASEKSALISPGFPLLPNGWAPVTEVEVGRMPLGRAMKTRWLFLSVLNWHSAVLADTLKRRARVGGWWDCEPLSLRLPLNKSASTSVLEIYQFVTASFLCVTAEKCKEEGLWDSTTKHRSWWNKCSKGRN